MKLRSSKKRVNTSQSGETNGSLKFIICIFLVISTLVVYWQVKDHEFVNYDDNVYITNNLNVQAGLTRESVYWAFTTSHFANWHPVTWLSHMFDYELYGDRPKGHHLTSLFFHIANALILFIVLSRMTGAVWQCGLVAAMFALHPLNVESVAWVAERKNVLGALFWLLTMWSYVRYVEKPSLKRYGLIILFLSLGLMSKAILVTLPFVLLLLDYWPLGRLKLSRHNETVVSGQTENQTTISRLLWEKTPLLLLVVGSSITTLVAARSEFQSLDAYPLKVRFVNALVSYILYLQKTIYPMELSAFYPHPGNALPVLKGVVCAIILVGITMMALRLLRQVPYLAIGWFWYLGTLAPVNGIIVPGSFAMADRYAYVSLIGIFIVIAWGVPELISKWRCKEKVLSISAGVVILVLIVVAWVQVGHWKNSITLFKHAISVTENQYPSFALAYDNLGYAFELKGDIGAAITHYKTAIKINPGENRGYNNIGRILSGISRFEEAKIYYKAAIAHYKTAIEINPNDASAYTNLGYFFEKTGNIGAAITHYKTAIKTNTNPEDIRAYINLGKILSGVSRFEEAKTYYKEAIRGKPNSHFAHYNLANMLSRQGDMEKAITHYKTAIKIDPNFFQAHVNLGTLLAKQGSLKEAINYFQEALRLKPDLIMVRKNLEMAIREYGQAGESK